MDWYIPVHDVVREALVWLREHAHVPGIGTAVKPPASNGKEVVPMRR